VEIDHKGQFSPQVVINKRIEMIEIEEVGRFDGDLAMNFGPDRTSVVSAIQDIGLPMDCGRDSTYGFLPSRTRTDMCRTDNDPV